MKDQAKPSFFSSTMSGIAGFFKGILSGGTVGGLGGAAIGALGATAIIAWNDPSQLLTSTTLSAIGEAVTWGAGFGAAAFASLGAMAGTITGVVKSRETKQHSAEEIANIAKISLVQGMAIEHARGQQQHALTEEAGTRFQDAENARIAAGSATVRVP